MLLENEKEIGRVRGDNFQELSNLIRWIQIQTVESYTMGSDAGSSTY